MTERSEVITPRTISVRSEEQLKNVITKAQIGDQTALACLLEGCLPEIYRYSLGMLHHHIQNAEDTTQDIAIKMIKGIENYKPERGSFKNWLLTITHNHIIDKFFRAKDYKVNSLDELGYGTAEGNPHLEEGIGNSGSPEKYVERLIEAEEVRSACQQLSFKEQQVLAMTSYGELTLDKTAEELGIPPGTARGIRRRALTKLRRELGVESIQQNGNPLYLGVLRIFLENGRNPITARQLGDKLSRSTIDILNAIDYLKRKYKVPFKNIRRKGYYLDQEDADVLRKEYGETGRVKTKTLM